MITIDEAKKHLRVDVDADELFDVYIGAAQEQIESHTQRKVITDESVRMNETDILVNFSLKAAALLLVGNFYENREAVGQSQIELPLSYWSLIQPYRIMGV